MPGKKRLFILIPGFPADEADSTCLPFQQSLVRWLKTHHSQLEMKVVSLQYPFRPGRYLFHGVPVTSLGGRNRGGWYKWLLRRQAARQLLTLHRQAPADAILSFWMGEAALVAGRFARKNQVRHACWLMGQDAKAGNRYVAALQPQPDELIALSDFLQEEFTRHYGIRPAHVVLPGIDPAMHPQGEMIRDIDLLGAGSLIPLKQFDLFIEVVGAVRKQMPGVRAFLAGDGPERQRLEELVTAAGLQQHITLCGELPHHILLQLMHRSKLLLHASAYEGFGMVCAEALYGGAGVISFVRPVHRPVDGWMTAKDTDDMARLAFDYLKEKKHAVSRLPFPMEQTASQLLAALGL